MRFSVIYINNPEIREKVMSSISEACSHRRNPAIETFGNQYFSTMANWPDRETLMSLPLTHNVEELIWSETDRALHVQRVMVVEVEIVK